MKTKVCPCCDQPITGIYCKGCRKLVLNPVEQEIRYYLNTRHPQDNHDCTFHVDENAGTTGNMYRNAGASTVRQSDHKMTMSEAERKKAEIRARMERRKTEKKREYSVGKPARQPIGSRIDNHPERKRIILILTIFIAMFMVMFMIRMISLINVIDSNSFVTGFTSVQMEPAIPVSKEIEVPVLPDLDGPQMTLAPEVDRLFKEALEAEKSLPTQVQTD